MTEWQFPKGYSETDEHNFIGFVYLITNTITGKAYVGRKNFRAVRKGKQITSNWRTYFGSCKPLKDDIKDIGADKFTREILSLHRSQFRLNYAETAEQFKREVLTAMLASGERAFYNSNIMSRYFATGFSVKTHTPEAKAKISKKLSGRSLSAETKAKISDSKSGVKPSPEHCKKLSEARQGLKHSAETRAKMCASRQRYLALKLAEKKQRIRDFHTWRSKKGCPIKITLYIVTS